MKRFASILLSFTAIALLANPVLTQNKAAAGFEKLKSLVGEWQGTRSDGHAITVSYQIVSGGSALMEILEPVNEPSMVTMYHLDDDKLMMTHYCSISNQPQMHAETPKGEIKNLSFTFVDATNLAKPSDGRMQGLAFNFQDENHITQVWTWREGGKEMTNTFTLVRKK